jgi:hypothetical protein
MTQDKRELEWDELVHPGTIFSHPSEVVDDPDLTLNEKRAILSSWASDACAVESAPALRHGRNAPVGFDDIMDALRALDRQAMELAGRGYRGKPHWRRKVKSFFQRNDGGSQGQPLQ